MISFMRKVVREDAMVSIKWEVGGHSGSTECPASRAPYEVEALARAGYKVLCIEQV